MHFAAKMGGVGFFSTQQFVPILDNLLMDARVIDHCRSHGSRLLFPSSACAYPVRFMDEGLPLREDMLDDLADPDQMYGMEKLCITRLSRYADFDFRVAVLHTIYGEGQDYVGDRVKFPPQICYKFATAHSVEVWGDGNQTRTFLHIDDATEMLVEIFFNERYHGPVNVSHPQEVSVRQIIDVLSAYTGRTDIFYDSTKPTGPTRRPVDNSKFNSHYHWRPRVPVADGFVRLYEHIVSDIDVNPSDRIRSK